MAVGISDTFLARHYRFPNELWNRALISLFWLRLWGRKFRCIFDNEEPRSTSPDYPLSFNFASEQRDHFVKEGWVFIENFLPSDFHETLCREWPSPQHFFPVKSLLKSYDNGLIDPERVYRLQGSVRCLLDTFSGADFCQGLTGLTSSTTELEFGRPVFTRAYHRSSVVPHLDSVSTENLGDTVNLIYYLQGSGGPRGGGTCILRDAEGTVVFEPKCLNNSCLIYFSSKIYHGMRRMRRGSSRYMVACDYWPKSRT